MRYDPKYTRAHYDALGRGEADRWEKSRFMMMQREVFRRHLMRRVEKGQRVLDAGCGAGVYTRQLVELGAQVTALDISPVQLELCREAAPGAEGYVEGTIVDLSGFDAGSFDVVLAFGGSLSYCFDRAPAAVAELSRLLRPDGTFGCSVMSLYGACHHLLPRVLADLPLSRAVLDDGDLPRAQNRGHECHLFRDDELLQLLADAGLARIEISAPAWLSAAWPDSELPEVGTAQWNLLLDAELQAGTAAPAAGTHMIAWAQRERA